jgi:raffinose/stachyose/melibiose transport system substrate-binding protein
MNRSRQFLASIALVGLIAGCVPGSGQATPAATPPPAPSATEAAPSVAAGGSGAAGGSAAPSASAAAAVPSIDTSTPVTLAEWDTEDGTGPSAEMEALNAAFHEKYPNVTIKRTVKNFDDYVATIKLAASAPDAPDIFQGNEGYSVDAALVKAGLIVPLDDYSKAYGWDTRFGSPQTLNVLRWSNDGTQWTQGPLWGIAQKSEVLGVFYNKQTMQKLGITVPTTFDEFQQSLATAKAGNVAPIVVGGLDGWPLGHIFMMLQAQNEDPKKIADWTFAVPGSTFDDSGTQAAASIIEDWGSKGYFEKGFLGVTQPNAAGRFGKGEGLYFLTGPWENGTFTPLGNNVGWFPLPGTAAGASTPTTGSLSIPYHISSKSKHADIAAAWIDFITNAQAADVVAKNGDLPATPLADPSTVDPNSSLAAIIQGFHDKSSGGLLTPYLDWATDTMGDTLFGGLQKLTGGKSSPTDFTKEVQADWSKAHS